MRGGSDNPNTTATSRHIVEDDPNTEPSSSIVIAQQSHETQQTPEHDKNNVQSTKRSENKGDKATLSIGISRRDRSKSRDRSVSREFNDTLKHELKKRGKKNEKDQQDTDKRENSASTKNGKRKQNDEQDSKNLNQFQSGVEINIQTAGNNSTTQQVTKNDSVDKQINLRDLAETTVVKKAKETLLNENLDAATYSAHVNFDTNPPAPKETIRNITEPVLTTATVETVVTTVLTNQSNLKHEEQNKPDLLRVEGGKRVRSRSRNKNKMTQGDLMKDKKETGGMEMEPDREHNKMETLQVGLRRSRSNTKRSKSPAVDSLETEFNFRERSRSRSNLTDKSVTKEYRDLMKSESKRKDTKHEEIRAKPTDQESHNEKTSNETQIGEYKASTLKAQQPRRGRSGTRKSNSDRSDDSKDIAIDKRDSQNTQPPLAEVSKFDTPTIVVSGQENSQSRMMVDTAVDRPIIIVSGDEPCHEEEKVNIIIHKQSNENKVNVSDKNEAHKGVGFVQDTFTVQGSTLSDVKINPIVTNEDLASSKAEKEIVKVEDNGSNESCEELVSDTKNSTGDMELSFEAISSDKNPIKMNANMKGTKNMTQHIPIQITTPNENGKSSTLLKVTGVKRERSKSRNREQNPSASPDTLKIDIPARSRSRSREKFVDKNVTKEYRDMMKSELKKREFGNEANSSVPQDSLYPIQNNRKSRRSRSKNRTEQATDNDKGAGRSSPLSNPTVNINQREGKSQKIVTKIMASPILFTDPDVNVSFTISSEASDPDPNIDLAKTAESSGASGPENSVQSPSTENTFPLETKPEKKGKSRTKRHISVDSSSSEQQSSSLDTTNPTEVTGSICISPNDQYHVAGESSSMGIELLSENPSEITKDNNNNIKEQELDSKWNAKPSEENLLKQNDPKEVIDNLEPSTSQIKYDRSEVLFVGIMGNEPIVSYPVDSSDTSNDQKNNGIEISDFVEVSQASQSESQNLLPPSEYKTEPDDDLRELISPAIVRQALQSISSSSKVTEPTVSEENVKENKGSNPMNDLQNETLVNKQLETDICAESVSPDVNVMSKDATAIESSTEPIDLGEMTAEITSIDCDVINNLPTSKEIEIKNSYPTSIEMSVESTSIDTPRVAGDPTTVKSAPRGEPELTSNPITQMETHGNNQPSQTGQIINQPSVIETSVTNEPDLLSNPTTSAQKPQSDVSNNFSYFGQTDDCELGYKVEYPSELSLNIPHAVHPSIVEITAKPPPTPPRKKKRITTQSCEHLNVPRKLILDHLKCSSENDLSQFSRETPSPPVRHKRKNIALSQPPSPEINRITKSDLQHAFSALDKFKAKFGSTSSDLGSRNTLEVSNSMEALNTLKKYKNVVKRVPDIVKTKVVDFFDDIQRPKTEIQKSSGNNECKELALHSGDVVLPPTKVVSTEKFKAKSVKKGLEGQPHVIIEHVEKVKTKVTKYVEEQLPHMQLEHVEKVKMQVGDSPIPPVRRSIKGYPSSNSEVARTVQDSFSSKMINPPGFELHDKTVPSQQSSDEQLKVMKDDLITVENISLSDDDSIKDVSPPIVSGITQTTIIMEGIDLSQPSTSSKVTENETLSTKQNDDPTTFQKSFTQDEPESECPMEENKGPLNIKVRKITFRSSASPELARKVEPPLSEDEVMSKEQFDIEQSIQTGNDERAQATFKTDEGSQVTFKTDEAAQATFMTDEGSQATFMTDKGAQATFKTDEVNKVHV